MLFLWGLVGALGGLLAFLWVPLRLRGRIDWPGWSEAEVRLGPLRVARWTAGGPHWPARPGDGPQAEGGEGAAAGRVVQALGAFFGSLERVPVRGAALEAEGGVGDPALTALLYGTAWAMLGGALAATGQDARLRLTPRLDGPAGGSVAARAEISLPLWRLVLAAVKGLGALRGA